MDGRELMCQCRVNDCILTWLRVMMYQHRVVCRDESFKMHNHSDLHHPVDGAHHGRHSQRAGTVENNQITTEPTPR